MQAIINIMDQEIHPNAATERQTERERAREREASERARERAREEDTHSFLVTL